MVGEANKRPRNRVAVAALRHKYRLSAKRERMLLSVIVGQLEAELCWNASRNPWLTHGTATDQPTEWQQSREDSWQSHGTGKLDPCTCSEGLFGAERYAQAFERRQQEVPSPQPSALGPELERVLTSLRNEGAAVIRGAALSPRPP